MSNVPQPVSPESVGRTVQIIAIALIMGILVFGCVAFVIAKEDGQPTLLVSLLAVGMAVLNTVMRFVVPAIMVNAAKSGLKGATDPDRMAQLAGLYQSKMIVGMALIEGAAFFNLVAYIMEKQFWSYGVVAFLLAVMAISFPSQGQFESWAEDMKRDLN